VQSNNAASDNDSIHTDTKSISSFNDSFVTANQQQPSRELHLEKELNVYKEKFQTAEEIRQILTSDLSKLQEMADQSKENIKRLVKDKVAYEEKLQLAVKRT
jgi:predicted  nucleic acid-binding Zn-ribbon protein